MIRIARSALVALAVGCIVPRAAAVAQGDSRPTVAVMPFHDNATSASAREVDGLHKALPDLLGRALAANPAIVVIEREHSQRILDAQRLSAGAAVSQAVAVRVGRLLGAQHVVFGGFNGDPSGNIRIDARAVNVESGQIEYTERVQDRADNVMPLVEHLAAKLAAGVHLPLATAATIGGATTKLPLSYVVTYGRALDLADRGDTSRAVELFDAVLKDFPGFAPATAARRRLQPAF
jgi:TolB-like protein